MRNLSDFHPQHILVCQLRQIGDVLLSTPAIRLLNERYPDAVIDVLTEKKCVPVLKNNSRITNIWPIDKVRLRNPLKALAYYAHVGWQKYDLIVDFQQLPRSKWVVRFSRAPIKLTFSPPWYNKWIYTHWANPLKGYAAKAKASVLAPLGITWDGEKPELWLTDDEMRFANDFLDCHKLTSVPFITVDPSHRRETRRWPARHYAKLIQLLREKHPNLNAVVLYGPREKELGQSVVDAVGDSALLPEKNALFT